MYLDEHTFKTVVSSSPLVSIDLVIKNSTEEYLLGLRKNSPALGYWFVPGGRVLKNEALSKAFSRLCNDELGIDKSSTQARFLGNFEHFYTDSVFGDNVSTHYIVLGYELEVELSLHRLPTQQHIQYRWFKSRDLLTDEQVHIYTKRYVHQ